MEPTEQERLENAVDAFAAKMKEKLLKKADEGFSGWDQPQNIAFLRAQLMTHATEAFYPDYVDVANFAMILERFPSGFWESKTGGGARAWRELKEELTSWINTDEAGAESQEAIRFVRDSVIPKIEKKYFTEVTDASQAIKGKTVPSAE